MIIHFLFTMPPFLSSFYLVSVTVPLDSDLSQFFNVSYYDVPIMYFDLPPLNGKMPSTGINIGDHSSDCTCDVH